MHKWKSFGASVIGPMHIKNNIPNQDSFIIKKFYWGQVFVVADGLGSKKHSDIGSKAICNAIVNVSKDSRCRKNICFETFLQEVHKKWIALINPLSASDCATTCLLVIQTKKQTTFGMLGDGMIVCLCKDFEDSFVFTEQKDQGFSNSTNSLRSCFRFQEWTIKTIPTTMVEGIVLCTDGIADDLLPETHIDFSKELIENYSHLKTKTQVAELKKMLKDWPVPRHTDDKTLVCVYKRK